MKKLFLVGAPRSGTTWLQILLGDHAGIATTRETHLFDLYLARMYQRWLFEEQADEADGLRVLLKPGEFDAWCRSFASTVFDRIAEHNPSASVLLEKTPGHLAEHKLIKRLFPESKFLHIVRDPRAVVASLLAAGKQPWGFWAPKDPSGAAQLWLDCARIAKDELRGYGDDCREVRYEELSQDTNSVLCSIHEWMDLPVKPIEDLSKYSIAELNARSQEGSRTNPKWENRTRFFRKGAVQGWKDELTRQQVTQVEQICGDVMQAYGYMPVYL